MNIRSKMLAKRYEYLYKSCIYLNKNNPKTKKYQEEGYKILRTKVDNLPEKIAFTPKFLGKSTCAKIKDKIYIFISKSHLKEPTQKRFDTLFHEIGHWLHFQNLPPIKQQKEIWKTADIQKIEQDVSKYATKKDDGSEFVAEVFKWLVKGKKFDSYITNLYNKLHGPKVHQ